MKNIEEYRKEKMNEAGSAMESAMKAIGWEDPDGTIVVQEEDWDLVVGLYGEDPKGFRLETELDRKRQDKKEAEHPEKIGEIVGTIAARKRYSGK